MKQLKLNSRNWIAFKVGDLFEISTGCNITKSQLRTGQLPRITAKATDNGVDAFTDEHVRSRLNENCVSISFLGNAFYQPYKASYDMKIHSVTIIGRSMNQYIGLFLANQFNREFKKFSYGNQLSSTDLPKQHILLPVTADNQPDWQFMEDYMRQQEIAILQPSIEKLRNQLIISELGGGKIEHLEWREYNFTDIFTEIKRGKRLKTADHIEGKNPYISSTALCNGVDGFIGNTTEVRMFENCLTVANSGSVGSSFYHIYRFVASDHVTQLKREGIDRYAYLFIAPLVNRLAEKYSFNREINDNRIKREKLILPTDSNGNPDFAFMSKYMRQKEYKALISALTYFEQKLT